MNLPADDLETFDRLLGPDLVALLDELDAVERALDAPGTGRGTSAAHRLEERRERLGGDVLEALARVRRRLERGVPPPRDERTMPLPFVDIGAH